MTKVVPVGDQPTGIAYNPNNDNIYVTNQGSGTVHVTDATTYAVCHMMLMKMRLPIRRVLSICFLLSSFSNIIAVGIFSVRMH